MENSPWLWAKGLGVREELKKSQEKWQKSLAEMEEGL